MAVSVAAIHNGGSFNLFSSPPAIPPPSNAKTNNNYRFPTPTLPTLPPLFHKKKQQHHNQEQQENGNSGAQSVCDNPEEEKAKRQDKGKGKKVYRYMGHYTTKLGDDRGVTVGSDGTSYRVEGAPFEFKFSYTETPKVKPLALREPPFVPFGPPTVNRPWTGRAPLPKSKKMLPELDSFNPPPPGKKGVKYVQAPGPFLMDNGPKYDARTRDEILGEPLSRNEINELVEKCIQGNRQVNLGRDGLTHNMLELIHTHWRRRRVCKIKCKGVPTVDMDNVCYHLEEKTGGKIIRRVGGVVYLFRGRNYNCKNRPTFPLMHWKPATPLYPKLIERAPAGITIEEADALRRKGRRLPPICKLGKNGVYFNLVKNVREAFEECDLVRINCRGMKPSDYKRIGAKLKELVPCVLLSFDKEHILMWRGREYTPKNSEERVLVSSNSASEVSGDNSTDSDVFVLQSSGKKLFSGTGELTTSLETGSLKRNAVTLSKDVSHEGVIVTSEHNGSLQEELEKSSFSVQCKELVKLGENEDAFKQKIIVQTCNGNGTDTSEAETGLEADYSSHSMLSMSGSTCTAPFSKTREMLKASELECASDTGLRSKNTCPSFEYVGCDSSTAGVANSLNTSSESLPSSTTGVIISNTESMECIKDGSVHLLSQIDAKQKMMHQGDNLFGNKTLVDTEANGCNKTAQSIELLWQQAIESRLAILLDGSSLDLESAPEKSNDFGQMLPTGQDFKQTKIRPSHQKNNPQDEESKLCTGKNLSNDIYGEEIEEISPFSESLPLGTLPVDDLAKLLAL